MRAQKGYLISKGVKMDAPRDKPTGDDVKRWKAMMEQAEREDAKVEI